MLRNANYLVTSNECNARADSSTRDLKCQMEPTSRQKIITQPGFPNPRFARNFDFRFEILAF
jgi:hypothetical protein